MKTSDVLDKLTNEERALILKMVREHSTSLSKIEIDDICYYIPEQVNFLIESLVEQIKAISTLCCGSGISN